MRGANYGYQPSTPGQTSGALRNQLAQQSAPQQQQQNLVDLTQQQPLPVTNDAQYQQTQQMYADAMAQLGSYGGAMQNMQGQLNRMYSADPGAIYMRQLLSLYNSDPLAAYHQQLMAQYQLQPHMNESALLYGY